MHGGAHAAAQALRGERIFFAPPAFVAAAPVKRVKSRASFTVQRCSCRRGAPSRRLPLCAAARPPPACAVQTAPPPRRAGSARIHGAAFFRSLPPQLCFRFAARHRPQAVKKKAGGPPSFSERAEPPVLFCGKTAVICTAPQAAANAQSGPSPCPRSSGTEAPPCRGTGSSAWNTASHCSGSSDTFRHPVSR